MLTKSRYVAKVLLVVFPAREMADIGRVIWQLYCGSFDFASPYKLFGQPLCTSILAERKFARPKLKMAFAELERQKLTYRHSDNCVSRCAASRHVIDVAQLNDAVWIGCWVCLTTTCVFRLD
jgi:hypothetical protein